MPPSGDDDDEGVAGEGGNTDRAPAAEDQVPAQDPALAPAQVTEGVLPRQLKRGNFYVAGAS